LTVNLRQLQEGDSPQNRSDPSPYPPRVGCLSEIGNNGRGLGNRSSDAFGYVLEEIHDGAIPPFALRFVARFNIGVYSAINCFGDPPHRLAQTVFNIV
jgi:hypothetical protein